jgi:hypothetical protein
MTDASMVAQIETLRAKLAAYEAPPPAAEEIKPAPGLMQLGRKTKDGVVRIASVQNDTMAIAQEGE